MKHGTTNAYNYRKCRCDECRAANAAYMRQWRKANPAKEAARRLGKRGRAA